MSTLQKNTIFTNVAVTSDGDVWWEGMTKQAPSDLVDWTGQKWTPDCGREAAHPNSRYTTPASECSVLDPDWSNPNGVPITSFIFGGRRTDGLFPLVAESLTWEHGLFLGSLVSQNKVSDGKKHVVREAFAMMPYVAYHVGEYLERWNTLRDRLGYNIPKIFFVNWFKQDAKGNTIWPGYAENSRILKWIFQRSGVAGESYGHPVRTPIGFLPSVQDLDLRSLNISKAAINDLLKFNPAEWTTEVEEIRAFYDRFESKLPRYLGTELETFVQRVHFRKRVA